MSRSKGVRDQHTTTRQSRAGETTTITNEVGYVFFKERI